MQVRLLAIVLGLVFLAGVVSSSARPAYAETFTCMTTLDGSREVPSVDTGGIGSASLSFDSETNELSWEIEFSGLSGPATAAHFHGPAALGANAGVQVNIGDASGLSSPMAGSAVLTLEQESFLLGEEMYINIHTEANPNGEIRGQVSCESELPPSTDGEWQTAMLAFGDDEHEIQYMITGGTLDELTGDVETQMITAAITAEQDGELTIQLPREIMDSVANGQDLDYIVFVDEISEVADDNFGEDVRTLTIPFLAESKLIDIVSASIIPVAGEEWQTTTLTIGDEEHDIQYTISGGTLDELTVDQENSTITAMITAESDGKLTIRLPRDVADSKDGQNDSPFIVTVDGEDSDVTDDNGATARTLSINFSEDARQINLIGTFVVPEFGALTAVVLAAAIVGIIVATGVYSKFSFLPKT